MSSGYNMPPGVYESDIPGWNDVDHSWINDCTHCDYPNEVEGIVDSRYGGEVEWVCEYCGETFTAEIDLVEVEKDRRADEREEYLRVERELGW